MKSIRTGWVFLPGLLLSMVLSMPLAYAEGQPLRVFTGSTAHWTDLIVALRKGYFSKEGRMFNPRISRQVLRRPNRFLREGGGSPDVRARISGHVEARDRRWNIEAGAANR